MNGIAELTSLVVTLETDAEYVAIEDRFDRMQFMLKKYADDLKICRVSVLKHCRHYSRTCRKSLTLATYHKNEAKRIYLKYLADDKQLTNEDYDHLIVSSNRALRRLPIQNKTDGEPRNVIALLEIYVNRAEVEFDYYEFQRAISDLTHACAALQLVVHDLAQSELPELMLAVVALQTKCLKELGEEKRALRVQEHVNVEELPEVLKIIETLDRLLAAYYKKDTNRNELKDYFVTPKLRLAEHNANNQKTDRYFEATEPIGCGEKILQERASEVLIFVSFLFKYCNFCYQPIVTFWPCKGCSELGFCSRGCSERAYEEFHKYECGIYGLLLGGTTNYYTVLHMYRTYVRYGFDVVMHCEEQEFTEPYRVEEYIHADDLRTKSFDVASLEERRIQCRAITSLLSNRDQRRVVREICASVLAFPVVHTLIYKGLLSDRILTAPHKEAELCRMLEHIATGLMRMSTNGFCWSLDNGPNKEMIKVASCLCFSASFFNHSCVPNVSWYFAPGGSGVNHLIACRDIQPGDALTISYGPRANNPLSDRQVRLHAYYCFYCRCDACLYDAASCTRSFRCKSKNCNGPLVVQDEFTACLSCGHSPPSSNVTRLIRTTGRSAKHFQRTLNFFYQKGYRQTFIKFIPIFACALLGYKLKEKEKALAIKAETLGCLTLRRGANKKSKKTKKALNVARVTDVRLAILENAFQEYASLIYEGSYYLLDKCTQLLEVYEGSNRHERGLLLIDYFDRCLDSIYPEWTYSSQIKLLYSLDYSASFYHRLAINQWQNKIDQLIAYFTNESPRMPSSTFHQDIDAVWFWQFCSRLNRKLIQVLEYDLLHRGDFFPILHEQLKHSSEGSLAKCTDTDSDQDSVLLEVDSDEECFRQLYRECRARLSTIERIQCGE